MVHRVWAYKSRRVVRSGSADFAWQVHAAIESWTARADLKASILLAFQGGAFVVAITLRELIINAPGRWPVVVAVMAIALLVAAMVLAAAATLPALGSARRHRGEHERHLIYFGHVRLWQPPALAARLARLTASDELRMLASQLVVTSRLTWRKHRLLQASVTLTVVVLLALAVAVLAPYVGYGRWIFAI